MNPWATSEAIDRNSREPYGEGLATWLWEEFQSLQTGHGIFHNHRDYCGIGLVKTDDGVALCRIEDGSPDSTIMNWKTSESFVHYWSDQSDYGLCGADPSHPEVLTNSEFELNNQRINRHLIYTFLDRWAIDKQQITST